MKVLAERRPLIFALLVTLASFTLAVVIVNPLRQPVVSNVEDVAPADLVPPTDGQQALAALRSPDTVFWFAVALLAVALIFWLGWRREAGFGWPPRWQNSALLVFPLLVGALSLSNGMDTRGFWLSVSTLLTVLIAVFAEEALFRGTILRALAPTGPLRAVVTTSLLTGALILGAYMLLGPWPEAVQATVLATCGGFTYGALRWRTRSIWSVLLLHATLNLVGAISSPSAPLYLFVLLLSTLGFVLYGLFLLRNPNARADGGLVLRDNPARAHQNPVTPAG